jgi:adenylate kinase family enzyme
MKNNLDNEKYLKLLDFINKNRIKKINIIGRPGSGKTTLSLKLKKSLIKETLNIDSLYEKYNNFSEINYLIEESLKKNLIIDGTYTSLLSLERVELTDLFIYMESNIFNSMKNVIRREILKQYIFKNEKISIRLVKQILLFNNKKKIIEKLIDKNKIYYY